MSGSRDRLLARANLQAFGLEPEDWQKSALTVVVVGASGDLARKKIFPALFALYHEGQLPEVHAAAALSHRVTFRVALVQKANWYKRQMEYQSTVSCSSATSTVPWRCMPEP